jgi:ABC-type Fe3+-hydroxamate transport system substrate-binding protein
MNTGWTFEDALARLERPPRRIVSLVPSYTQSLFDLGYGKAVVGISDYCTHPFGALEGIQRVGGPTNFRVDMIRELAPDLVLVNQEENERERVLALQRAGLNIWLSFPRSIKDTFKFLADIVRLYADPSGLMRLRMLETGYQWAAQAVFGQPRLTYFCPIWQDKLPGGGVYWMTFNQDTYSSDLLDQLGGTNVFSGRERRYPLEADLGLLPPEAGGERDRRYPRVRMEEVLEARPEVILLPDEPYRFGVNEERTIRELFAATPAVREDRVYRIEGRWITWCGTCIGEASIELPRFFEPRQ